MTNTNRQRYGQSSSVTEEIGTMLYNHTPFVTPSDKSMEMSVAGKPLYCVSLTAKVGGMDTYVDQGFHGYSEVTAYAILNDGTQITLGKCTAYVFMSDGIGKTKSETINFADKLTTEQMNRVVRVKGYFYGKTYFDDGRSSFSYDCTKSGSISVVAWSNSWENE